MFEIFFDRDIMNNDPKKRNRIKGIVIRHDYYCYSSCWCDCRDKCKYSKGGFRFHNFSVAVHRFFEYRLHIKLPYLLHISKLHTDLSGTTTCPFNKTRRYTCWDCEYSDGNIDGMCLNEERNNTPIKERECNDPVWGNHGKCKFFEKTEWTDDWDEETGKHIF